MRVLLSIALVVLGCSLGCGSGDSKAPPGAESSDTSLDVNMGSDESGEPNDDKPSGDEPADDKPADDKPE